MIDQLFVSVIICCLSRLHCNLTLVNKDHLVKFGYSSKFIITGSRIKRTNTAGANVQLILIEGPEIMVALKTHQSILCSQPYKTGFIHCNELYTVLGKSVLIGKMLYV